ncbi:serine/threonine-protein phosphatase 4 regulatory subunit 2-like isoform X2 [Corythoichthys intestinalis]|uniref:serine/threonine-protein phosphatase 4 regulatory subunit 2-like isoform X2 n=1 Tax=Corythoichthys intestinalis TaxID=161448 RepID=UPI0025A5F657|nr:serine/threonine-protein phosphatase 4 regulatory subunit 2-like isoform X2 [Corythoichthys intestinalis]
MDTGALLEAFQDFEKKEKRDINPLLEQFLCHVAKTGEAMIPWSQFKSYFMFKMEKVIDDFHSSTPEQRSPHNPNVEQVSFEEMKKRILKIVDSLNGIPFTIQRLCELLTDPKRNYTGTDKFLRGIEKNVMVVSCVYPPSEKNGTSSSNRMNGVMFPGTASVHSDRNVNGPSMPKQLNRPKISLSPSTLSTNGLPECAVSKEPEPTPEQEPARCVSADPSLLGGDVTHSRTKNRHTDEEELEDDSDAEKHKSKRLKVNEKQEDNDTTTENKESSCKGTQKSAASESSESSCNQEYKSETSCRTKSIIDDPGPISAPTEACGKEADEKENSYCDSTVHQLQRQLKENTLSERNTGESSSSSDGDRLPSVKLALSSVNSPNLSTGGDADNSNCTKTKLEPGESD